MKVLQAWCDARRGVLGDRRRGRGRWAGSVLDAVVGVFLTQNVSDALSSKAWMTLAAAFPLRPGPAASGLLPAPTPQGAPPAAGEEAGGAGAGASGAAAAHAGGVQGRGPAGVAGAPGSEARHAVAPKQASAEAVAASAAAAAAQPDLDQPGTPISPVRPDGLGAGTSRTAQQPATPPIREQAKAGSGCPGPTAGAGGSPAPGSHSLEAAAVFDSSAAAPAGARELPPVAELGVEPEISGAAPAGAGGPPAAAGDGAGLPEGGRCGGGRPAGGQAWDLVGADADGRDFGDSIDWEAVRTAPMEKVGRAA